MDTDNQKNDESNTYFIIGGYRNGERITLYSTQSSVLIPCPPVRSIAKKGKLKINIFTLEEYAIDRVSKKIFFNKTTRKALL